MGWFDMQVIGEKTLEQFCRTHADLRVPADDWLDTVRSSVWRNPHELKNSFPSVSLLAESLVVFNLKGNRYRLLAKLDYENQRVRIRKVGTHAEYSKWKL